MLTKLNELQRMLLLAAFISFVLILFSLIGVFMGQVGWLIGVVIGSLAELIDIILLYKGSDYIFKENRASLFLLFFFLRMIIAVLAFLTCLLLEKKANIPAFYNSIWGAIIGFAPTEFVILIVMSRSKANSSKEVK